MKKTYRIMLGLFIALAAMLALANSASATDAKFQIKHNAGSDGFAVNINGNCQSSVTFSDGTRFVECAWLQYSNYYQSDVGGSQTKTDLAVDVTVTCQDVVPGVATYTIWCGGVRFHSQVGQNSSLYAATDYSCGNLSWSTGVYEGSCSSSGTEFGSFASGSGWFLQHTIYEPNKTICVDPTFGRAWGLTVRASGNTWQPTYYDSSHRNVCDTTGPDGY